MATHAARMRKLYPYLAPSTTADHIVIGGGAIGLAVAAGLANTAGKNRTTFLVERNSLLGQETTARNSEVIHSGIYYPIGSLRSKFCIRGRDLLYARCQQLGIGHRQTEKLIVATETYQINFLDHLSTISADPSLHNGEEENPYTSSSTVPCWFLSPEQAIELEPDLSRQIQGALLVTSTGIVDSQGLVDSLAREVEEEDYAGPSAVGSSDVSDVESTRGYGAIIRGTRVVRIDRDEKGKGWVVQLEGDWEGKAEGEKGEISSVQADVVINAAGLAAVSLTEGLIPASEQVKLYTVKGNYMSYKGPGVSNVSRLIYPCPSRDISALGTHLTMDLNGNIKFGPDVDPIGDPEISMRDPDFWKANLHPSADRIASIAQSAQNYLPGIDPAGLSPDYSGVRPNIAPPGSGFSDFLIRHSPERKGLIELLGFASPGLTSSLAVGEHVARMVRKDVWREKSSVESLAEGWE